MLVAQVVSVSSVGSINCCWGRSCCNNCIRFKCCWIHHFVIRLLVFGLPVYSSICPSCSTVYTYMEVSVCKCSKVTFASNTCKIKINYSTICIYCWIVTVMSLSLSAPPKLLPLYCYSVKSCKFLSSCIYSYIVFCTITCNIKCCTTTITVWIHLQHQCIVECFNKFNVIKCICCNDIECICCVVGNE